MSNPPIRLISGTMMADVRAIEAHGRDASLLFQDVLQLMIRSTQLTFEAQGRPAHWDDLKESTMMQRLGKALKGKGAKKLGSLGLLASIQILRDTGALMRSVGLGSNGPFEADDGFGEADTHYAAVGTNSPGWQNQFPDTRGWREAREFLLFQQQDVEDILDMTEDWLLARGPYS
jgi:phage gpG-like protein